MANVEQERSRALWMDEPAVETPPLDSGGTPDALVIGAGIAGLVTAYELAQAGRAVTVVDRGRLGRGMTARTSAHLTFELDDRYSELEKLRGRDAARRWYESQSAAVDRIEQICKAEGIDCDFARLDGYLVPGRDSDVDLLHDELEAARACGFADAAWVDAGQQPWLTTPAIRFPRQARFHPMKFLNGVIAALQRQGARLYANTAIVSLEERDGRVTARTEGGAAIAATDVVVATNSPFHLKAAIHSKQAPYRTYVIAAPVPKETVADVLLWDTLDPYHYVRIEPGHREDVLIVGGEDHKSGKADDISERLARLERWMRERYPETGGVSYRWSGQVYEPSDFVGFIGKSPEHDRVFLITGDSGQGLTTAVAGALILRDLVAGRANPWAELYDPARKITEGVVEHVKENFDAAKKRVGHLTESEGGDGDARSLDDVVPGSGALIKIDGKVNAVHRGASGAVTRRLAACTHAGCTVHWNGFEECWDCPCHGSQFSADGEALQAPAVVALAKP
jgi:glycine/D-amino acid oxidase-like deaminating enzyme/nitrite reductase/ring-hydroxylating ferredoxin subunit